MPRQYDLTIPPEYRVMSTQVTQYGEPIMPDVNPAAMGSFGRRPQDANDAHQIGMQEEVWKKGESPLKTAQQNANSYTAWLRKITRTGQINAAEVTEYEGSSKVTYHSTGSDDQVSNVKGMRITGDPETVGAALRNATSSSFERVAPVDSERAQQSAHRTVRNMPDAQRLAFQAVLARDPSALQSLAPTALAGVSQVFEMVDESGVPRPVINGPENASNPADFQNVLNNAARKQSFAVNSRPAAVFHPAQSNYEDSYGLTNTTMGALGPAQQMRVQQAQVAALNNLARANAQRANLTARWKQQMVAANNAARNGQNALAKQQAQAAANTQKQLAQANAKANQAVAQKQQVDKTAATLPSRGRTATAPVSSSSAPAVQKRATTAPALTVNPSARAMALIKQLAAARPAVKQTLFYLERATAKQQEFVKLVKDKKLPQVLWGAHFKVIGDEFMQAAGSASKVKIPAERQFTQDLVGLATSNYMVFRSNLEGNAAQATNWAANAQKYATRIQAAIAAVLAAIDAAKNQQTTQQQQQQQQQGGGSTSTSTFPSGGGSSSGGNTAQDELSVSESYLDSSGGGAGQSGSTSTSSFSTAELTPGAQSYVSTGSQMTVSDEYVNADGTVDPEFATGGEEFVAEPQTSKGVKIALTLGLIAATGAGLYMVAKR